MAFSSPSKDEFSFTIYQNHTIVKYQCQCQSFSLWFSGTKYSNSKRGTTGDPLSLYLFLLAAELLVATINNNQNIEGLGKERKRNIKCPSYADDMTLTLFGSR